LAARRENPRFSTRERLMSSVEGRRRRSSRRLSSQVLCRDSRELSRGSPPRPLDLGRGKRARSDLDEEDQRDPTDRSEGEANGRRARSDPNSRPVTGGRRSRLTSVLLALPPPPPVARASGGMRSPPLGSRNGRPGKRRGRAGFPPAVCNQTAR
jgi:hypothetical protein